MSSSALNRLCTAALIAFALCFVYVQIVLEGALIPPLAVFIAGSLVIAGVAMTGWRWAPLTAAIWFALVFAVSVPIIVEDLSGTNGTHQLVVQLVTTLVALTGFVAGVVATLRARRPVGGVTA